MTQTETIDSGRSSDTQLAEPVLRDCAHNETLGMSNRERAEIKKTILRELQNEGRLPRGVLTEIGKEVFTASPPAVSRETLRAIQEFREFLMDLSQVVAPESLSGASADAFAVQVFSSIKARVLGIDSAPLVMIATVCPDYPYNKEKLEFEFGGAIQNGVGLVGNSLLEKVLPIAELLSSHQVNFRLEFLYADIEGADSDFLESTGLDTPEFMRRLGESVIKLQARMSEEFKARDIGGEAYAGLLSEVLSEEVSPEDVPDKYAAGIATRRAALYRRMFRGSSRVGAADFARDRAARDIADHVNLGRGAHALRKDGIPASIITMSISALAKFINAGSDTHLPIFNFAENY